MPIDQKIKPGKPAWLKKSLPHGGNYQRVRTLLSDAGLHTVCKEANCPNMFECFSKDTSTFMILGSECTRNCRFCNVTSGTPSPVDPEEPLRVAKAALDLQLKYIVITSVTRDDLDDGGASHFSSVIHAIRSLLPGCAGIEVLIPDFKGDPAALKTVLVAKPDVLNHNIETVSSLYPRVRPSLALLQQVKAISPVVPVKSGIMVGLGETMAELEEALADLFCHGCDIITIGQYLQPTRNHLQVEKYYSPEEFKSLEKIAKKIGFKKIAAGPFVRSSYRAHELSGL